MKKIQGIYSITHLDTGRKYIGSSKDVKKRLGSHRTDLKYNRHSNPILQNYCNKYGVDSFQFDIILEVFNLIDLIDCENNVIGEINNTPIYDIINHEKLFNTQWAGKTGAVDPTKYKRGKDHHLFGKPGPNNGKIFSDNIRENMSIGQTGKKYTNRKAQPQEARDRMAATKKNVPWSDARRKAQDRLK